MRHSEFKKLIDAYLANELDEWLQSAFEEHMLACKSCREELLLCQAIVDGIAEKGEELLTEDTVPERSFITGLKDIFVYYPFHAAIAIAANIILMIVVGLGGYSFHKTPAPSFFQSPHSLAFMELQAKRPSEYTEKGSIDYWEEKYEILSPQKDTWTQKAHDIFDKLLRVSDHKQGSDPELVVLDAPEEGLLLSLKDGHIVVASGAIKRYGSLMEDPDHAEAALAFMLGHELAHQKNGDFLFTHGFNLGLGIPEYLIKELEKRGNLRETMDYIKYLEFQADIRGILIASLAGYDVSPLLGEEGFIKQWARATTISEDKIHPDPLIRQEAITQVIENVMKESLSFFLGVRLAQIGYYNEAIQNLEHFCLYYPASVVYNNIGVAYHLWALSISPYEPTYKHSLILYPEIPTLTLMGPGDTEKTKEQFYHYLEKAIENYNQAKDPDPYDATIWHNLACALADQGGNPDLALGCATQAIILDPNNLQAHNTRGIIYLQLAEGRGYSEKDDLVRGWTTNAISDLIKAQTLKGYSDPLYNVTIYYAKIQDRERYLDYLQQYLDLDPYSDWAHEALSRSRELLLKEPDWLKEARKKTKDMYDELTPPRDGIIERIEGKAPGGDQSAFDSWGRPDDVYIKEIRGNEYKVRRYIDASKDLKVSFINGKAVLLEAVPGYGGSTALGIAIGDPVSKIYQAEYYGRPQEVYWCMDRRALVYPYLHIGFEIEDEKVRGWFLFEKSGD